MTEQQVGVAIAITSPIWLAALLYYGCRVCYWLDGKPWSETK